MALLLQLVQGSPIFEAPPTSLFVNMKTTTVNNLIRGFLA